MHKNLTSFHKDGVDDERKYFSLKLLNFEKFEPN